MPISHEFLKNLDGALVKYSRLMYKADRLLSHKSVPFEVLLQLERDALDVQQEFHDWDHVKFSLWAPIPSGDIHEAAALISGCAYTHSGPVDSYADCK